MNYLGRLEITQTLSGSVVNKVNNLGKYLIGNIANELPFGKN